MQTQFSEHSPYTVTITDKAAGCTTVKTFTIGTTNYTISTNNQHATKCVTTLTCDGKLTIAEEDATWSYILQADQVQGGTQLNCYEIKECIITKFKGEPKKLGAATKKDDFERCIGEIYCDFPNTNVFPKEQLALRDFIWVIC